LKLALLTDGKILVSGVGNNGSYWSSMILARYNSDGTLDTTFGASSGKTLVAITSGHNVGSDILIQPDGKILLGGYCSNDDVMNTTRDFALVRFNSDGNLDSTFGTSGKVTTDLTASDIFQYLALQSDGQILASGSTSTAGVLLRIE